MIYTAIAQSEDLIHAGQWVITPQYTRADGTVAPDQNAIVANGIQPTGGDLVLCIDSRNEFDQSTFQIFNDNAGACPVIIATYATLLNLALSVIIKQLQCGAGGHKMVLGDALATYCQNIDAAIQALYTWGATGVPPGPTGGIAPFPGTPTYTPWNSATLSPNHTLD